MIGLLFRPGDRAGAESDLLCISSVRGMKKSACRNVTQGLVSILLATIVSWPTVSDAQEFIYRQDWDQVTSAVSVLQLPALQRAVSRYESTLNSNMVIRYPGGDDGNAWAVELRNWLVSLGVSLDRIKLQPGSGVPEAISIRIEPRGSVRE